MKFLNKTSLLISFSLLLVGCNPHMVQKDINTGFTVESININDSATEYLTYIPEKYYKSGQMPLLLFLHGAGERGDSLPKVKTWGPPKIAERNHDFPFLMIAPQCPQEKWWTDTSQITVLKNILNNTIAKYNIDTNRIYLSGLSMGGFGTWKLAYEIPTKFAAIAPVCGGGKTEWADKLSQIPIWAFHGEMDNTVPIERTKTMVQAIKMRSPEEIKMTLYPETGHFSWIKAYNQSDLFKWLLSHEK